MKAVDFGRVALQVMWNSCKPTIIALIANEMIMGVSVALGLIPLWFSIGITAIALVVTAIMYCLFLLATIVLTPIIQRTLVPLLNGILIRGIMGRDDNYTN